MKVLHATKVQGIGGAEQHLLTLLPALRERGIDARFLSLDAGGDAERFHRALDERAVPWRRVRCGRDVSPRLAASFISAVREERPDLLHTHMVHADVYGSIAAHALRTRFVSTRHNDDRYLLGPFRFVDRAFMSGVGAIIAISDAVRAFHIRAGLPAAKLVTIHYGLDELPVGALRADTGGGRHPGRRPARARDRPPDRAEGSRHAARCLRSRARATTPTRGSRSSAGGAWRLRRTRAYTRLGLDDAVLLPGTGRALGVARRGRRSSRTVPAGRASGSCCSRRCSPACPSSRRASARSPRSSSTATTGLLAPAGDAEALAAALSGLLADPQRRRALGDAGAARAFTTSSRSREWRSARSTSTSGRRALREVSLRELAFGAPGAGPDRTALDLVPRPQQPPLRRAAAAPRSPRRLPAAPARRTRPARCRLPGIRRDEAAAATARPSRAPHAATANLLTLDFDQLAHWPNAAVMDADDPFFTPREIELLSAPALRGIRRHRRARRAALRGARGRQAVGRDPAGRQPVGRDARAARARRLAASSRARSCSGGWRRTC